LCNGAGVSDCKNRVYEIFSAVIGTVEKVCMC
jgi:hypothetical protein